MSRLSELRAFGKFLAIVVGVGVIGAVGAFGLGVLVGVASWLVGVV